MRLYSSSSCTNCNLRVATCMILFTPNEIYKCFDYLKANNHLHFDLRWAEQALADSLDLCSCGILHTSLLK